MWRSSKSSKHFCKPLVCMRACTCTVTVAHPGTRTCIGAEAPGEHAERQQGIHKCEQTGRRRVGSQQGGRVGRHDTIWHPHTEGSGAHRRRHAQVASRAVTSQAHFFPRPTCGGKAGTELERHAENPQRNAMHAVSQDLIIYFFALFSLAGSQLDVRLSRGCSAGFHPLQRKRSRQIVVWRPIGGFLNHRFCPGSVTTVMQRKGLVAATFTVMSESTGETERHQH